MRGAVQAAGRGGPANRGRVVDPSKDHPPRAGLEHAGHGESDHFSQMLLSVLRHDHRAVVKVTDPLPWLLASLEDLDHQRLARQHDGLQGIREVVQVDDLNPLEPGDLVQVVIVGDHPAAEVLGQYDEFLVDFLDAGQFGNFGIVDLDLHAGRLLEFV